MYDIFINVLFYFVMGLLGMLGYTTWKSKSHFLKKDKNWTFSVFISDNIRAWTWTAMILLIVSCITGLSGASGEADSAELLQSLKLITGLDLKASPGGFVTLGVMLNFTVK